MHFQTQKSGRKYLYHLALRHRVPPCPLSLLLLLPLVHMLTFAQPHDDILRRPIHRTRRWTSYLWFYQRAYQMALDLLHRYHLVFRHDGPSHLVCSRNIFSNPVTS